VTPLYPPLYPAMFHRMRHAWTSVHADPLLHADLRPLARISPRQSRGAYRIVRILNHLFDIASPVIGDRSPHQA